MDYRDTPMDSLVNEVFDEFLKTSFVTPPRSKYFIGMFDLDHWHYLGSTELGFPMTGDAAIVSFFVAKDCPDVRAYHVSYDKNVREFDETQAWEFHPFMANQVLPWQYNQVDLYRPIRSTFSHYLVDYMKTNHEAVWDPKIGGWRSTKPDPNAGVQNAPDPDGKYAAALEKQKSDKKTALDEAFEKNSAAAQKLADTINRVKKRDENVVYVDFHGPTSTDG